jgi:hypothetical protein
MMNTHYYTEDCPRGDTHFFTKDCPRGPGKRPQPGDREYTVTFYLQDGNEVTIHMGNSGINKLREFVERHLGSPRLPIDRSL